MTTETFQSPSYRGLHPVLLSILWLALTLFILVMYPIYSNHPEIWQQHIIPAVLGIVGCWLSVRLFTRSFLQRAIASITLLLWLFFLSGWARQLYHEIHTQA